MVRSGRDHLHRVLSRPLAMMTSPTASRPSGYASMRAVGTHHERRSAAQITRHERGHLAIDVERPLRPSTRHRFAQRVDMAHQQVRAALQEIDGEEVGAAGHAIAAVVGHGAILSARCVRRNARKGLPPYAGFRATLAWPSGIPRAGDGGESGCDRRHRRPCQRTPCAGCRWIHRAVPASIDPCVDRQEHAFQMDPGTF